MDPELYANHFPARWQGVPRLLPKEVAIRFEDRLRQGKSG